MIAVCNLVLPLKSALSATMGDDIFLAFSLNGDGFHKTSTNFSAIAGVYIDMLAPKTLRTVVGVAIPAYEKSTLLADEILSSALKFLTLHILPVRIPLKTFS